MDRKFVCVYLVAEQSVNTSVNLGDLLKTQWEIIKTNTNLFYDLWSWYHYVQAREAI